MQHNLNLLPFAFNKDLKSRMPHLTYFVKKFIANKQISVFQAILICSFSKCCHTQLFNPLQFTGTVKQNISVNTNISNYYIDCRCDTVMVFFNSNFVLFVQKQMSFNTNQVHTYQYIQIQQIQSASSFHAMKKRKVCNGIICAISGWP